MDIDVRQARDEELDTIGELTARSFLDDGLLSLGAEDPYLPKLRDARDRARHTVLLVAADATDDTVLGSVALVLPGSGYAEVSGPGEAEFRMLAVAHSARRRGAAEALVRACLERAREAGLRRVVISTGQDMPAAHRLYQRLGFHRLPERDWAPLPGRDETLWVFAVDL